MYCERQHKVGELKTLNLKIYYRIIMPTQWSIIIKRYVDYEIV